MPADPVIGGLLDREDIGESEERNLPLAAYP
jgi:hypothetical protein